MHQGVGRAPKRQHCHDGIVKRLGGQHMTGTQIRPHHVYDAFARGNRHLCVSGIWRRNGGGTRQRQAKCLDRAGHGAGRPHGHAVTRTASDAGEQLLPLASINRARAQFVPALEHVTARTQRLAACISPQHGTRWHINHRNAHGGRPHHQARRGLVAPSHEHSPIHGIGAQ